MSSSSSSRLDHRRRHSMPAISTSVPRIVIDSSPCESREPRSSFEEQNSIPALDVISLQNQLREVSSHSMPGGSDVGGQSAEESIPNISTAEGEDQTKDGFQPAIPYQKPSRFAAAKRAVSNRILTTVQEQTSEDEEKPKSPSPDFPLNSCDQPPPTESPSKIADRIVQSARENNGGSRRFGFFRRFNATPSSQSIPSSRPASNSGLDNLFPEDENRTRTPGILSALLSLASQSQSDLESRGTTPACTPMGTPPRSGASTPRFKSPYFFGSKSATSSSTTLPIQNSVPGSPRGNSSLAPSQDLVALISEKLKYEQSKQKIRKYKNSLFRRTRSEREDKVKAQIAQTLVRQQFLVRLCWALMRYGAPSHRMEEYLETTAAVLQVNGQFLYTPACTIISFDDSTTHTTEVKLVRSNPGVDLGKLYEVHDVYKDVTHGRVGIEQASAILRDITDRGDKYPKWFRVLAHGLAAAAVGPFGFQARIIDVPMGFLLGIVLGTMQLYIAEFGTLYANLFDIGAAFVTSFLARAIGSINGGSVFCFSALAQSSIALILPGYIVLCACLELSSRKILAGSVRMVYAVLYTIFLGYGIMIGSTLYGLIDSNASSAVGCARPLHRRYNVIFVALFSLALCMVNQAHWRHTPVMIAISVIAYCTTFFSSFYYFGTSPLSNMCGSLVIGILANLYSRLGPTIDNWSADAWLAILKWYQKSPAVLTHPQKEPDSRMGSTDSLDSIPISGATTAVGSPQPGQTVTRVHFDSDLPDYPYAKPKSPENPTDDEKPEGKSNSSDRASSGMQDGMRRKKIGYNLAAAAMLPALFVQVPSGLAVSGSLLTGITSADAIIHETKSRRGIEVFPSSEYGQTTTVNTSLANQDLRFLFPSDILPKPDPNEVTHITVSFSYPDPDSNGPSVHTPSHRLVSRTMSAPTAVPTVSYNVNTSALNIMYSVVQVGVAMTVGLSVGALVVYPIGKRKSGVFSF